MTDYRFINALKRHAASMDTLQGQPRFASVVSYDPIRHTAKVRLDYPGDDPNATYTPVVSGWLPICTNMTGSGWGVISPLAPGQQVVCIPHDGDPNSFVIMGAVYSTANVAPQPVAAISGSATPMQVGEFAVQSQSGQVLRFNIDGSVFLRATTFNVEATTTNIQCPTINIVANTSVNITSDVVNILGDLSVTGSIVGGYGGDDQVGLQTHTHAQGNDSHGDSEQDTTSPIAGI